MKATRGIAVIVTAALALNACSSRTPQFTAADEAQVRSLFDSTVARITRGDWTSWAGEFSDSAIFHPPNGKAIHGRAAILAFGQAFPLVEQFNMWDVHVWGEGNLAYGTSAIAIKTKNAPADTSKQVVVFRRAGADRWEVVAGSFNSDLPPAPAPPASASKKPG